MKIETSELIGAALDYAVAKCEGMKVNVGFRNLTYIPKGKRTLYSWKPSTNWAQGGPIIEREKIIVDFYQDNGWCCLMFEDENAIAEEHGPTPLAAAMRCYVASKLGDEVEVPYELVA